MSSKVTISCRVAATGPGLNFTVKLDDRAVWQGDPMDSHDLKIDLDDNDDTAHELVFELSGKTGEHTKVDQSGNIIDDVTVAVSNLAFDGIELGHMIVERAVYCHDYNGTAAEINDKFYGTMGCNGTVKIEFTTPIYLWLLENM